MALFSADPSEEFDTSSSPQSANPSLQPDLLIAANNHNVAAGGNNWFDNTLESLSNAPKFFGTAIASGAVGFANTGIAIGNLFTDEKTKFEEVNLKNWLSEYDEDLGKYYRENADSIDTVGFVIGSFIPGTLGIKALNLAQKSLQTARATGVIGGNMARATNLLVPEAEIYIARAANEIAATNQRFKFMQVDVLKAVAAKTGQATLEAAAFETAVLATSFKSPFFSEMDAGDIVKNFLVGTVLGGVIGGAIGAASVRSGVKRQVVDLDQAYKQAVHVPELPDSVPVNGKLVNYALSLEAKDKWIASTTLGADGASTEARAIISNNLQNAKATQEEIRNKMRTLLRDIAPDQATANTFADTLISLPTGGFIDAVAGIKSILRPANVQKSGSLGTKIVPQLAGLELPSVTSAPNTIWSSLWGYNKGAINHEFPKAVSLADGVKLNSGESIQQAVDRVAAGFKHKVGQEFDVRLKIKSLEEVQSRYLWAADRTIKPGTKIHSYDFPLLERAYETWDEVGSITLQVKGGKNLRDITTKAELLEYIQGAKDQAILNGVQKSKLTAEEMSERLNVSGGYIDGTAVSGTKYDDIFYRQSQAAKEGVSVKDIHYKPKYMGLEQDPQIFDAISNQYFLDAHVMTEGYKRAAQQGIDVAVEDAASIYDQISHINQATGDTVLSRITALLPESNIVEEAIQSTNRFGSNSRLFYFANGNYGSAESIFQQIGATVNKMNIEGGKLVSERLQGAVDALRMNPQVATEYAVTREIIAATGDQYVAHPTKQALINVKLRTWMEEGSNVRTRPVLRNNVPDEIPINRPETMMVWQSHMDLLSARNNGRNSLRAASGLEDTRVPDAAYAIKPNPRTYPHFAFVVDDTITGARKTTMIHAADSGHLEELVRRTQQEFPEFKIVRKDQSESYHKALGDFDYDKTLHENYIDSALSSKGINSQFMPVTDGKLLSDELQAWHMQQTRAYNADIISTKYQGAFKELEWLGRQMQGFETSRYADAFDIARNSKSNPYIEYMKTALNVSNVNDYPLLVDANRRLDNIVSSLWNTASNLFKRAKSPDELNSITTVFEEHGFKTAYYTAATDLMVNRSVQSGVLSKFVRGANSLLATSFLRLDWLNAVNNKLGSAILTSTELRSVIRNIEQGNAEEVGKLAGLAKVKVPGQEDMILSPGKLMMRAISDFWGEGGAALRQKYETAGWIQKDGLLAQARAVVDDLTLSGGETELAMSKKLRSAFDGAKKLGDFGETITGNKFVEGFNRFLSARIMDLVTEQAVTAGRITEKEASSYINTFVNRTQVNLVASQRPLMFQGPIGSAVGLFMSYQVNLMQQLFRYVAPGQRKSAAMLMGMQTSFYGMNGLPGFQAFNQHIIGEAAGNYDHSDLYTLARNAAGNDAANFMLYGIPSNLLRTNLYSRGDLTPQNPTILPTSLGEIPFVSAYTRVLGNLKSMASNAGNGAGVWNTVLAGLEGNSINRPLAGLAQVARGMTDGTGQIRSLDSQGKLLGANDLYSLSTIGRLMGGRPFDESIVRNEMWRIQAYKAASEEKFKPVTRAVRLALSGGGDMNSAMDGVFNKYLESGRKAPEFNRWFLRQSMESNTSQAQILANNLKNPYSQRMLGMLQD